MLHERPDDGHTIRFIGRNPDFNFVKGPRYDDMDTIEESEGEDLPAGIADEVVSSVGARAMCDECGIEEVIKPDIVGAEIVG